MYFLSIEEWIWAREGERTHEQMIQINKFDFTHPHIAYHKSLYLFLCKSLDDQVQLGNHTIAFCRGNWISSEEWGNPILRRYQNMFTRLMKIMRVCHPTLPPQILNKESLIYTNTLYIHRNKNCKFYRFSFELYIIIMNTSNFTFILLYVLCSAEKVYIF